MELQDKLHRYRTGKISLVTRSSLDGADSDGSVLSIKVSLGYGHVTAFHVGGEHNRWELFMAGAPLTQVTLAEHQAEPGDIILSNESWKMVMNHCDGNVLSSGDVKLLAISKPIPSRPGKPLKLDPRIEGALSSYIPSAILSKMVRWATTPVLFASPPPPPHTHHPHLARALCLLCCAM